MGVHKLAARRKYFNPAGKPFLRTYIQIFIRRIREDADPDISFAGNSKWIFQTQFFPDKIQVIGPVSLVEVTVCHDCISIHIHVYRIRNNRRFDLRVFVPFVKGGNTNGI